MRNKREGLGAIVLTAAIGVAWGGLSAQPVAALTTSITNYHYDLGHTGNDPSEPSMAGLGPYWNSSVLDGRVYGEPMVLNNTVYVATQQNTIYALNATTGATRWSLPLATAPYNLAAVPKANVDHAAGIGSGCGKIDPMGVIGTPLIDPALGSAGTLFAVAETWDGSAESTIKHELVAVDLAAHTAAHANIDPSGVGFDTGATRALEQERGALALAGGKVVVPFGGLAGDCGGYHGFMVSLPENLSGTPAAFEVAKDYRAGGIWAAGGPAVDGSGNIYVATGNGFEPANSTYEYTDGVVKLNSSMVLQDYFGPSVWRADDGADRDLGSQGPLLIPRQASSPLVFTTGKQLTGYLLDTGNLGHIGGQLFGAKVCDQESFGASAYLGTSTTAGYLYVPCAEGIRGLAVNTSTPSFARSWQGPGDATGPPIVAGGLVWVHGSGTLYGLNPTTGVPVVTLSGVDTAYNFSTPSASGGVLFYAGNDVVQAFNVSGVPAANGHLWTGIEANGTRDMFSRHADGTIMWSFQEIPGNDSSWSSWRSLGSQRMATRVSVAADTDGRLEIFAGGTDGRLYRAAQIAPNSGYISAWSPLDGIIIGQPSAARNADGTLQVFATGQDNAAYSWRQTSRGTWGSTSYGYLGGSLNGDPTIGLEADGRLELFARYADYAFWTASQLSPGDAGWSAWSSLGGLGRAGAVGVGWQADGRQEIFVHGIDEAVWTKAETNPNGGWGGWVSLGGITLGDVDVNNNKDGRMQVVLRGSDNAIWTNIQNTPSGVWVGYSSMGGLTRNNPVAGLAPPAGTIDVFVIGVDNAIWQNYQPAPNGGFTGWRFLGGGPAN